MEQIDIPLLVSRWLHIAAAIVAVGGAAFQRFALQPGANSALNDEQHAKLRDAVRTRWSRVVFLCIAILLITGGFNFVRLAMPPRVEPMPYHGVFAIKFLAALTVFFIASALAGRSPAFEKIRAKSATWLSVLLVLAAIIVLVSGILAQIRTTSAPAAVV